MDRFHNLTNSVVETSAILTKIQNRLIEYTVVVKAPNIVIYKLNIHCTSK